MPLVSIITPTWNVEAFIGETIHSVQAQTVSDWELLLTDDCSTDGTMSVLEEFAASDPRIRPMRQTANGGPALARQASLERATGRFVAFLDSDDLWLPQKLECQLPFMTERAAALSYTAFRRINHDGSVVGILKPVPASLDYAALLKNTAIATLTAVVDRDVSGPIAMKNEPYDDFCLWLSILKRGHIAYGLNEDLARYRVRGGSVSSRPFRSASWVWNIYRNVEGFSLATSARYLCHYGFRAWSKRREF